MKPLALTDHQLAFVSSAARAVPASRRTRFLQDVARMLADPAPSDRALKAAVSAVLGELPTSAFVYDGRPNLSERSKP